MKTVLVTGATGNVGFEVVQQLQSRGVKIRVALTNPEQSKSRFAPEVEVVRFGFGEPTTYLSALQDVDAMFLMRPPQISNAQKFINPLIDAAKVLGVRAVTFLSVQGAQGNPLVPHHAIEQHLKASNLEYCFLRAAFFMQNLTNAHRRDIVQHHDIMIPALNGKTAFVDVRDLAAVAALTLTEAGHTNTAYELTGSEALTYDQVAAILTEVLGRKISYSHPNLLQFWQRRNQYQDPIGYVLVMTALYAVAALGQAGHLTNKTAHLLGREPITFKQFARDHVSVWQTA